MRTKRPALFDTKPYTKKREKPMLMAGNADYSKIKPYHDLQCDMSADSSDIDVTQVQFKKFDNGSVAALFFATKISGLYKSEEHKSDKPYCLMFNATEYEIWKSKAEGRVKVQPSEYEKLVLSYFDGDGAALLEGTWTGTISIQPSSSVLKMIEGSSAWNVIFNLQPFEGDSTLPEGTENAGGKRAYGGGQKEADKLNDRKAFMLTQIGLDPKLTILEAVVVIQAENKDALEGEPIKVAIDMINQLIVG